jgi:hypothetical protein
MEAIKLADKEDGLVWFIRRIHDEFKNTENPLDLNKTNKNQESAPWQVAS